MKTIALSWHPGSTSLTAGGFKRFYEIARRAKSSIIIIDRYPSLYKNIDNKFVTVIEYGRETDLKFLNNIHPIIYKIWDRIASLLNLVFRLLKLPRKEYTIYVPFSELSHLTLAAVLGKIIHGSRLVLCNLNVNTFFPDRILNVPLHKFSDRVITISRSLKFDLYKTGIVASDTNGVGLDPNSFSPRKKQPKLYSAIFVGRHIPEKGIWDLVKIWQRLKPRTLITVGDVPGYVKPVLKSRLEETGLSGRIIIKGQLPESEKINLYHQSQVCVFPSLQEGWGIVPQEAVAAGLPVVAYDLPVYQENIAEMPAVTLVPVGNHWEFAQAVLKWLEAKPDFVNRALNGSRPKLNKFSWDKVAQKEWNLILH